jgi:hypothetical protein
LGNGVPKGVYSVKTGKIISASKVDRLLGDASQFRKRICSNGIEVSIKLTEPVSLEDLMAEMDKGIDLDVTLSTNVKLDEENIGVLGKFASGKICSIGEIVSVCGKKLIININDPLDLLDPGSQIDIDGDTVPPFTSVSTLFCVDLA